MYCFVFYPRRLNTGNVRFLADEFSRVHVTLSKTGGNNTNHNNNGKYRSYRIANAVKTVFVSMFTTVPGRQLCKLFVLHTRNALVLEFSFESLAVEGRVRTAS